jgi:hypothetical protein
MSFRRLSVDEHEGLLITTPVRVLFNTATHCRAAVGISVRILVSSGRDFNLGRRSTNTFDQLIRKTNKLKYFDYDGIIFKE